MKKQGLVVCRTGMGSSMMLMIKLEQVIEKYNLPIEMHHDVVSAVDSYDVDFVVTMNDLVEQLRDQVKYIIGIEDLMNKEEMKEKLIKYLEDTK